MDTKFFRAKEKTLAVHTKRARRPQNASGKSNSSSVTSDKRRPIKRTASGPGANNRALRKELTQSQLLGKQLNERKVDLIKVDLQTASTFAKIAQDAMDNREKRLRNREHARRGYDAILHFAATASLGRSEREEIDQQIRHLKMALEELGESFA